MLERYVIETSHFNQKSSRAFELSWATSKASHNFRIFPSYLISGNWLPWDTALLPCPKDPKNLSIMRTDTESNVFLQPSWCENQPVKGWLLKLTETLSTRRSKRGDYFNLVVSLVTVLVHMPPRKYKNLYDLYNLLNLVFNMLVIRA